MYDVCFLNDSKLILNIGNLSKILQTFSFEIVKSSLESDNQLHKEMNF